MNNTTRMYTSYDMIKMSKFCHDNNLKGIELLKAYNKQFPEKSAKEQVQNLMKALDTVCDCPSDNQIIGCKAGEDCYHLNL